MAKNVSITYDQSLLDPPHGPMDFGYPHYIYSMGSYAGQAFDELGLQENENSFASGELLGHQYSLFTIEPREQTRSSSETAYLTLALRKTSLVVYIHTFAKKILFDGTRRATGVLQAGGVPFEISANMEVILSAGGIQSPQLLMVSGIGPSKTLNEYGIPIIADRPGVGSNLQDNVLFGPSYQVNLESTAIIYNPEYAAEIVEQYLVQKIGPLANVGFDYYGYGKISDQTWANTLASSENKLKSTFPSDWPEAEWFIGSSYLGKPPGNGNYGSVNAALTASLSRGNITIQSADMKDHPVINPNWLTDPVDQEMAVAAFKLARVLFYTKAMQQVVIGPELSPGEDVSTDAEILEYIKSTCLPIFHASCTCAMGKRDDQMAVVDSQAKVIRVDGLRVVDVSAQRHKDGLTGLTNFLLHEASGRASTVCL